MGKSAENIAVLGLQWGDEGKGKLVDLLSANFSNVVRFQGGNNAGHTVVINGESIALHQVPSGAHHPGCFLVIGSGSVLDFDIFHEELESLRKRGIDILDRLLLSDKAHIILPYHIAIDKWREGGSIRIGTTGRGIGPTYEAKAARHGVRVGDIKTSGLLEKIVTLYKETSLILGNSASLPTPETVSEKLLELASPLLNCIGNVHEYLYDAWRQGKSILFEGAQATMLDIDHGTYPFVTSSNCTIGGLFTGTGLPPKALNKVIGVAKAYTTRVGAGPFPSELTDSICEHIRDVGHEYGTTTGRPRRCGWFDAAALRYACRVNGVDALGIMKLDVLDGLERIGIVTAYKSKDGKLLHTPPSSIQDWEGMEPVVDYFDGWSAPTKGAKSWSSLPSQAQKYLKGIEKTVETPIAYVSTGPDREEGLFV